MKQSINFEIESVTVNVSKVPVTIKGVRLNAEAEYSAEEMQAEGSVFCQVIETLVEKFGWLKPLAEKAIQIDIKNKEMLSQSLESQIKSGKCEAYGPHGWSIRHDAKPATISPENKKKH